MALAAQVGEDTNWIVNLVNLPTLAARKQFLRRTPQLRRRSSVEALYDEVVRLARVDLRGAAGLATTASWLAQQIDDEISRAISLRAHGHVAYLTGRHASAVRSYEAAIRVFQRAGADLDVGRTCSGAIHVLIYLGQYKKALHWARRARRIFQKYGDHLRLARLDVNVGNILYRQDRFERALALYGRAYRRLHKIGEPQDIGIVLRNLAVCHISLNQFGRSVNLYLRARRYCERHNMPLLVAEADYNIAYLHYLRGQYTLAIGLYEAARKRCEEVGDQYHRALCDLDQSELYLEINLVEDGRCLAEQAFSSFKSLGMQYEAAKALTNMAIAATYEGNNEKALDILRTSRSMFTRERNDMWCALVDMYQGMVLYRAGRDLKSRRLCRSALSFFRRSRLATKAALCELLLARLDFRAGQLSRARKAALTALRLLRSADTPSIAFQAWSILGDIHEGYGQHRLAFQSFKKAHEKLDKLQNQLHAETKITFLQDKLSVYENLVRLCLTMATLKRRELALSYIERAKSRSLADLLAFRSHALWGPTAQSSSSVQRAKALREELNWIHRWIELEGLRTGPRLPQRVHKLRRRARELEAQLLRILPKVWVANEDSANLQTAKDVDLDEIRCAIPEDSILLEYYVAAGMIYSVLISKTQLDIVQLAPVSRVYGHVVLLQLQLSKSRLGVEYQKTFSNLIRSATDAHLHALYADLILPIRDRLRARHLIIVPHGFLHCLPMHALFDGHQHLIDEFSISYAPSASVYSLCAGKNANRHDNSLIMGVPDVYAPQILEEVKAVAATLPSPHLFVGADATAERLRTLGPSSGFIHIATHGEFRGDNPMFSSIRLGDSQLSVFDLYDLHIGAELVTLSGCGTGLNVVKGGDELLGLVRGLLYAGAQSVLLTLWDVHDQSTAEFMKILYRNIRETTDKSEAVRNAILELRRSYPDVYYWAPFVLVGKFTSSSLPGAA